MDQRSNYGKCDETILAELHRFSSKITIIQFLLLRTLIIPHKDKFNPKRFNLEQNMESAKDLIEGSKEFCGYLHMIQGHRYDKKTMFYLLREQQMEIMTPPVEGNTKLSSSDESPVNSTFITLLQAIAEISERRHYKWRNTKISLVADFSKTQNKRKSIDHKFTAITDGQLQHTSTYEIKSIVECKINTRLQCTPDLDMQESSQMVAWIKEYPNSARQRVAVAQDGNEIYVIFAKYDDGWVKYLEEGDVDNSSFLRMHQFGPYRIDEAVEMKEVATILLAITL